MDKIKLLSKSFFLSFKVQKLDLTFWPYLFIDLIEFDQIDKILILQLDKLNISTNLLYNNKETWN